MSVSWKSGLPYDLIRALRDEALRGDLLRIIGEERAEEIWEYPGFFVTPAGDVYSTTGRRLKKLRAGTKASGYKFVGLTTATGARKYEMVHRLVAKTFIPNLRFCPEVNHIDCNKANNAVSNLEWVTRTENSAHAQRSGLIPRGERHPGAKINREIADRIREATGRYRDIGQSFGVSAQTVCNIKLGRYWT